MLITGCHIMLGDITKQGRLKRPRNSNVAQMQKFNPFPFLDILVKQSLSGGERLEGDLCKIHHSCNSIKTISFLSKLKLLVIPQCFVLDATIVEVIACLLWLLQTFKMRRRRRRAGGGGLGTKIDLLQASPTLPTP